MNACQKMNLGIGFGIWNLDLESRIWNVDLDLESELGFCSGSGFSSLGFEFGLECWISNFNLGLGLESAYRIWSLDL